MKEHRTQRLFWKKWPYKVILSADAGTQSMASNPSPWARRRDTSRLLAMRNLKNWILERFPDAGIRCETNVSVFLATEEEFQRLLDSYGHKVLEVWKPESTTAKDLLVEHEFDVVRERPWYGKYPIRARIPFNNSFRQNGVKAIQDILPSLNEWHCAGILKDLLDNNRNNAYGWGQPLHLYLADAEDAAMLRLCCGDYIERFERVRNPK